MNNSSNFTVLKVVVDNVSSLIFAIGNIFGVNVFVFFYVYIFLQIYPYIFVEDKYPVAISGYMSELWSIVEKALNFRSAKQYNHQSKQ